MVNPHLDNGTPWGGSAPYETNKGYDHPRPMRPERPPGQPSSGPHTGYGGGYSPHEASHQGYNPRPNIGRDRMGIMSQPGGYGSDTYNALVGGANRPQQGGGFDRRKWSSALGHPEMAAVDPSDWSTILKILEAGGDPGTETKAASLGNGLGSLDEYQMAELSNKQGNFMESGLGNPNWFSNFEDYYNTVTGKGDWKQKLGWKDKATEQEVIDKLNQMMLDRGQSLPWSTTT